jgi:hypothetical protein
MNAPRFRVFDPLRGEYATPFPALQPMAAGVPSAALFDSEAAAVLRGRELIGSDRPWLVMEPKGER